MIQKLRSELTYYKELVYSLPVEQSFLTKDANHYSSLKYLNKAPNKTRVKEFIQEFSCDSKVYQNQASDKISHYTQRRKERNYYLNRGKTSKNTVNKDKKVIKTEDQE